ncbi:carboxypeptidase-like regulatory domain-containing protein [Pedobacter caeni]|uniref:CarboxypepD_reg-like domain-containing protein n=1 Tax=Pedobacter caeni TaxID=288992 RepID=A0A1M5D6H3_9SPHI|nr:carboxypeptidase-like regulatory domain-containing protein [Pedobacter caeni]SHF62574.1 CarboxypepD_reg-like domain-containing protein [Pedobacter caeni]
MNNDWLDIGVLEDYLDGKLDAKTMNRVEREALEDPFVAEALAGLSASPKRALQSISLLQKQLQERIAGQQESKKTKVITWQRLSIAATAAVLFISVSIIFWMKETAHQNQLAKQPKSVDVDIAPVVPEPAPPVSADALAQLKTAPKKDAVEVEKSPATLRNDEVDRALLKAKTNAYAANRAKASPVPVADAVPETLKEVVVVGYPVMRKQAVTASATAIVSEEKPYGNAAVASARMAAPVKGISTSELSGKVTSEKDGGPIPGVLVKVEGTKLSAITDAEGRFRIPADSSVKGDKLVLNYLGYSSKVVPAKWNEAMSIRLAEEHSALSEVVVTGMSSAKKEKPDVRRERKNQQVGDRDMASIPEGGWDKWARYIRRNNKLSNEPFLDRGVELSFVIGTDGRPADVQVLNGIDEAHDQEAKRLVLNGPKWKIPANPTEKIILNIIF